MNFLKTKKSKAALILSFEIHPPEETRNTLKELKFKWNNFRREYYGYGDKEKISELLKASQVSIQVAEDDRTDFIIQVKTNRFFLSVMIISICFLVASYTAEIIFQKIPCQLCKLERISYFGMFFIGLVGFSSFGKKIPLILLMGICGFSIILGAYHYGVEKHVFNDFCKSNSVTTMDDYKNMLHSPSCSKVGFAVFGIPASLMNALISLGLTFFSYFRIKMYLTHSVND